MPIKALFLGLVLGLASTVLAAQPTYPELEQSHDPRLSSRLEAKLEQLDLLQPAREKRLSVALADITDLAHPRFAAINPNHMAYAASLPKIAILFGAFARIQAGEMALDPPTRDSLTRMIRVSSNRDASAMLERVGTRYLADLLQKPDYRLYDPARNGGLWAGKPYGKEGTTLRDPLHNLSHGATVLQVARFYYLLETGQLVSEALSREMKSILGDPALHHKFVGGLQAVHPEARLFRKSGTWKHWHADSVLVERDGRRYIAVALAEDAQGESWLRRLIVGLDEVVDEADPLKVALLK
ncbi:MAG: serine hydrolase [Pseudomonadota bacterium]